MRATDDQIREKYLERAIRELNRLNGELAECEMCERGGRMSVLGSGHPQADVFMLKYAPRPSEVEEGVAFYGRSGQALIKSLGRLSIDPLTVYGTLCVKCPVTDSSQSAPDCRARVLEELAVVDPRIVVVMGEPALAELNALDVPLGREVEPRPGDVQRLTPSCEALFVPDIDAVARRGEREARVLERVPGARHLVRGAAALLRLGARLEQSSRSSSVRTRCGVCGNMSTGRTAVSR
ncbi:MAG: uracil-DNA glycosylase family protein [Thermoleophilaceae bacterium]